MIIKEIGQHSKLYCIENRNNGREHVLLHSIADVRNLMRKANFPEYAFT